MKDAYQEQIKDMHTGSKCECGILVASVTKVIKTNSKRDEKGTPLEQLKYAYYHQFAQPKFSHLQTICYLIFVFI